MRVCGLAARQGLRPDGSRRRADDRVEYGRNTVDLSLLDIDRDDGIVDQEASILVAAGSAGRAASPCQQENYDVT